MRRIIALILALLAWGGGLAAVSPPARADGDPASDVLATRTLFDPPDSGSGRLPVAALEQTITAANRAGYPIRVALIGSDGDLGSVTEYLGRPSAYAYYLWRELHYVFGGSVLVVMPQGFGLYPTLQPNRVPLADRNRLASLTAPGSALAGPAADLVALLAEASGHPVRVPDIVAVNLNAEPPGRSPVAAIIGFVAGLVAVLVAWGVSLRRRPLGRAKVLA